MDSLGLSFRYDLLNGQINLVFLIALTFAVTRLELRDLLGHLSLFVLVCHLVFLHDELVIDLLLSMGLVKLFLSELGPAKLLVVVLHHINVRLLWRRHLEVIIDSFQ